MPTQCSGVVSVGHGPAASKTNVLFRRLQNVSKAELLQGQSRCPYPEISNARGWDGVPMERATPRRETWLVTVTLWIGITRGAERDEGHGIWEDKDSEIQARRRWQTSQIERKWYSREHVFFILQEYSNFRLPGYGGSDKYHKTVKPRKIILIKAVTVPSSLGETLGFTASRSQTRATWNESWSLDREIRKVCMTGVSRDQSHKSRMLCLVLRINVIEERDFQGFSICLRMMGSNYLGPVLHRERSTRTQPPETL